MTYQGERARREASERGRVFAVSKLRTGEDGRVTEVLWGEVNAGTDGDVGTSAVASVAEVVDALRDGAQVMAVFPHAPRRPERAFVIVETTDRPAGIAFDDTVSAGRSLGDMATFGA